jgi:hypothetical protein
MDRTQTQWEQMLEYSFQNVWVEMSAVLPDIVAAILILIVGFIVAGILKKVVMVLAQRLQIDSVVKAAGAGEIVEKTGYKLNVGLFLGTIVKWFVLIVFFIFALDVLNLNQATVLLSEVVLGYLPRVLVATIILFGAVIVAQFLEKVVLAAATSANFRSAALLSKFSKYAVIAFAILAALNELQIATELVQMLFAGFVFALSLALGLSFGLGGREAAARYIESATRNTPRQ